MSAHGACDALDGLDAVPSNIGRVQSCRCARHGPVMVKRLRARAAEAEITARRVTACIPGIHAPVVLAHRIDGDATYLELAHAARTRETHTRDLLEAARALASATLDSNRTVDVAGVVRERLGRITSGAGSVSVLAGVLAAEIPRSWHGPASFCHGDLHPSNVIPSPAGIALIDWEQSAWLFPAWELTKMAIVADLPVTSWGELARQADISARQFRDLAKLHAIEGLHYAVERENRDHHLWRERARRTGLAPPGPIADR